MSMAVGEHPSVISSLYALYGSVINEIETAVDDGVLEIVEISPVELNCSRDSRVAAIRFNR